MTAALTGGETPAEACGGCFHQEVVPAPERSVVTDHRMAFAISRTQTVLWDQIRYSGDPREFAWVLPVNPGARVELSRDEWFAALDASTQPVISGPSYYGTGYGCALTGCGSNGDSTASGASPGPGQVQLVSQSVVGPYETVTLRATDPHALEDWLHQHGFAIPDTIQPTIDAYVSEGFDFIALRLRPDCGQRAMKPVRIVSPGADPSLPLRMVAAGVGANVGITLYVVGEGRYEPQNFPVAQIDESALTWDRVQNRSNYDELSQSLMGQAQGRTWLVEYANRPSIYSNGPYYANGSANPGLFDAYYGLCNGTGYGAGTGSNGTGGRPATPCTGTNGVDAGGGGGGGGEDAGVDSATNDAGAPDSGPDGSDPGDAALDDAGPDGSGPDDAGTDGSAPDDAGQGASADAASSPYDDAGASYANSPYCDGWDDLDVATTGMISSQVWVTRLRAVLPASALSVGDLRLIAAREQTPVSNLHYVSSYSDDVQQKQTRKGCAGAPLRHEPFTPVVFGITALLGLAAFFRRRR